MDAPAHLLLVEDDEGIARPLVAALEAGGHTVDHVTTGRAAITAARQVDAVLLDLGLPDLDGVEVCRRLRRDLGDDLPILVLTARDAETDVVVGLDAGADDYVTKPFRLAELQARLRALLRRAAAARAGGGTAVTGVATGGVQGGGAGGRAGSGAGGGAAGGAAGGASGARAAGGGGHLSGSGTEVAAQDVRLDPAARRAWRGAQELELTAKEFDLLLLLVSREGRVVTRDELARQVWDTRWMGNSKTIDVHVSSLRRKLGDDPADPRYIATLRGVGLRFEAGDADRGDDADGPGAADGRGAAGGPGSADGSGADGGAAPVPDRP